MAYTWDELGRLRHDGARTYAWDAAGRLISVTLGDATTLFGYTGDGDRLSKSVNGTLTTYTLDPSASSGQAVAAGLPQVLVEHSGASRTSYLYGLDLIGERGAAWVYHLHDGPGSVRQLVDGPGQVTLAQGVRPFGAPLWQAGSGSSGFGFTGEQVDASTGLVFLRARYYDAGTGRFLSVDPWRGNVQRPGTLNRYVYVLDNPVNGIDPSGLRCLFFDKNCDEVVENAWDWATDKAQDVATLPWRLIPGDFCLPGNLGCWGSEEYADWLKNEHYPNLSEYSWTGNDPHATKGRYAPLSPELWALNVCQAKKYGIPVELLAGTIAVEIEHDTDWWDPYLDKLLLATINCAEGCISQAGDMSELALSVWDNSTGRGPGPGGANFHTETARDVEEYYWNYYAQSPDLILPYRDNDTDTSYQRIKYLVSDKGNVHYTAAYLRMLADYRKGTNGSPNIQPHLYDLTEDDMTVVNGAFRTGIKRGWGSIVNYQNAIRSENLGLLISPYLKRYRELIENGWSCNCGE